MSFLICPQQTDPVCFLSDKITCSMIIGLVKWFDSHKGFGVIATPDKGEFFLHGNDFENHNLKNDTVIISN